MELKRGENIMRFYHGLSHTRIDNIYKKMIARCYKKSEINYGRYGGRGIVVCDEWKKDKTAFFKWAFENGYDELLTLDRINNDEGYSPQNCRWATVKEQSNNRKSNRYIEAFGENKTMSQWSDETGIKEGTIWQRLRNGWDVERALTQKPKTNMEVNHDDDIC